MRKRSHTSGQAVLANIGQLSILVLLIVAGIALTVPLRNSWRLSREIKSSQTHLNELECLYPLYAELASMEKPSNWPSLAVPGVQKLSENDVLTIPECFMAKARNAKIELHAVSPRVQTDATGEHFLSVDLHATGAYKELNAFLMELAKLPVLERMDKLEVKREILQEQFKISVLLALE